MLIKAIEIQNFRSILKENLLCDPLTVLVGSNGAGKSSFLQALRVFYDVNSRIGPEDFFNRQVDDPIMIRVTYGELRPDEQKEFQSYIRDGMLAVTKFIKLAEGKAEQRYYAATLQVPAFAKLRAAKNKTEQLTEFNKVIEDGSLSGLSKAKRGDDLEEVMRSYESAHPELLQPIEREEQFFGPRNVGGGKLDNYTKFVHLPAVRDVSDEMADSKSGTLHQLLDTLVMRKLHSREEVIAFKSEFTKQLKEIYDPTKIEELQTLADDISETLNEFVPGTAFHLRFGEVKLPEIPTPPTIPGLTEDEFVGDITRKGHGLQRALIFTLLQHLAILQGLGEAGIEHQGEKSDAQAGNAGPDLILAIEEPELYQHPQRCRYLADVLLQLVKDPTRGLGGRNQIIYTTHSSHFVSLDRFEQVRVCRKEKHSSDIPKHTAVTAFSLTEAARQLAEITDGDEKEFTADRFRARAYLIVKGLVSEGFFANTVVVVEGLTEAGALWRVSEQLSKDWMRKGIVVIPIEGKGKIDKAVIIFRGLNIPTYFIFDGDVRHKGGKNESDTIKKNRCFSRLAEQKDVIDFPNLTVTDSWACFEDNFEKYVESVLGKKSFDEHAQIVAEQYGYDEPSKALKNYDAVSTFIERIYNDGKRLPELESMVNQITSLAEKQVDTKPS